MKKVLEAKLNGEGDIHFTLRQGDYFQEFAKVVQKIALSEVHPPVTDEDQEKPVISDEQ